DWPAAVIESIEHIHASIDELTRSLEAPAKDQPGLAALRRRSAEIGARLTMMLEAESHEQPASVRWARSGAHGVSLHYVPIDVAHQLGALIEAHASAWIFTSATLAVDEAFSHFQNRVGVLEAMTARFGSPFDYAQQTLLYMPPQFDAPSSPQYNEKVIETALPILEASGGRAFLLFTSHRALRQAADILFRKLGAQLPYPV